MIKFYKVRPDAIIPQRATPGSAGFDLRADMERSVLLEPGHRTTIKTGISTELSPDVVGLIWPRSGLSVDHGLDKLAGVIDSDYRGEIKVALINHGDKPVRIDPGQKMAQIIFQQVLTEAEIGSGVISETERGSGGFGSTDEKGVQ